MNKLIVILAVAVMVSMLGFSLIDVIRQRDEWKQKAIDSLEVCERWRATCEEAQSLARILIAGNQVTRTNIVNVTNDCIGVTYLITNSIPRITNQISTNPFSVYLYNSKANHTNIQMGIWHNEKAEQ